MLDFMQIICFEQVWIHHPLDLLPQPDDQLYAAGHQPQTSQGQDGAHDDQRTNKSVIFSRISDFEHSHHVQDTDTNIIGTLLVEDLKAPTPPSLRAYCTICT